jgi:3-oxoacyl-[acyl-carrier-protein] synthase-3
MQDRQGRLGLVFDPPLSGSTEPYKARVAGVGRALPETTLTTADLMASTRHRTKIDLQRYTGVRERRVLAGDGNSHTLATDAARESLERAEMEAGEIDVIIGCGVTKSRGMEAKNWAIEPPLATGVAQALGANGALAFDIGNACAGMLTGAFVLSNWIRLGRIRRGLVVSGENLSPAALNAAKHVRNLLSREVASLTVGDAGAAMIVERAEEDVPDILYGLTTVAKHSRLCLGHLTEHDPGPRMFTRPVALHNAAMKNMPLVYQQVLEAVGVPLEGIHHVIPHQTSKSAIKTGIRHITEHLGQKLHSHAVVTVDRFGNTASTSHTVALVDELQAGRVNAGERVALLALASGLVVGAMVFTADEGLVRSYPKVADDPTAASNGAPAPNGNGAAVANGHSTGTLQPATVVTAMRAQP